MATRLLLGSGIEQFFASVKYELHMNQLDFVNLEVMALHRLTKNRFFSISSETFARVLGITLLFGSPIIVGFISPELIDFALQAQAESSSTNHKSLD